MGKRLDSASPGVETTTPEEARKKKKKKKDAPPGLQSEEELLTFVQYSPSLHNIER